MIKTAIIPVAGLGTRMLPASKTTSKEMLPLADKPIIEYIIEECKQAGIQHVILVTSSSKTDIEDYFDRNQILEKLLESSGKLELLESIQKNSNNDITISAVRQSSAKGLGHAVLCARDLVMNQPFAVLLPDVIVRSKEHASHKNPMMDLIKQFETTHSSQLLVEEVDKHEVDKYGVVELKSAGLTINRSKPLKSIVEKPRPKDAPSNLAVVGRYVFSSGIWQHLENTNPGVGGEIQLTDAILSLIEEEAVYAVTLDGVSKDCGCKLGYYKAFVEEVLARGDQLSQEFQEFLEYTCNNSVQLDKSGKTRKRNKRASSLESDIRLAG